MPRTLIVDDAIDLGRLLQAALKMMAPDMPTVVVPSAEEAMLEATREPPIDLLVTDIRLPGMTGLELVKKIRTRLPDLKVIMITGMTDETLVEKAKELQVNEFLFKPMGMPEFIEAAQRCLGMSQGMPQTPESEQPAASQNKLADHISGLRQRLGALGVSLLDEHGRIMAQAGELPAALGSDWANTLMAALSASNKAACLINNANPESALVYRSSGFNLILVPLGEFALTIALPTGTTIKLAQAVCEALETQGAVVNLLSKMGIHMLTSPEAVHAKEAAAGLTGVEEGIEKNIPEVDSIDLEALLKKAPEIKLQDAVNFWNTPASIPSSEPNGPDVLTYEQARKLGLAPDETN